MGDYICSDAPSLKWEEGKTKKFRDPVHGYITVPKIYVTGIIDTPYMQRIKEISQTGIYPLYPSATHNRFAHSLGVYHFSMMIYKKLRDCILLNACEIKKCKTLEENEYRSLEWDLNFCEVLLSIAALLHDVGHPAFSHSFEFLYDDIFMIFPDGECPDGIDIKYADLFSLDSIDMRKPGKYRHWQEFNEELQSKFEELQDKPENNGPSYERSWLKKKLYKYFNVPDENIMDVKNIKGNPHERMSAYMILAGMEGKKEKPSLYDYVTEVIEAYLTCHDQPDGYIGIAARKDRIINNELIKESIRFICFMITGQLYATTYKSEFCFINYRKSIKNCIIKIINGTIDADNIDYTMRNSYTAGYDTHKVDYNRLCQAFSVYFEDNILKSCFSSSSISVLEGFISARNAEPTWLYSHHKVVYYDVLLKMLFIYSSRYLSYLDAKSNNLPPPNEIERVKSISEINKDKRIDSLFFDKEEACTARYRPHGIYMISPLIPYLGSKYTMNCTTDASFDTLFKTLEVELQELESIDKQYEPLYSTTHNKNFITLIKEYISQRYKRSLWKSYPEYLVRIKSLAKELGIPWETVNNYMMELIESPRKKEGDEVYMNKLSFCPLYYKEASGEHPIEYYEDQYIYRFNDGIGSLPEEFKDDYFSYPRCVCKIVNVRNKDFNDLIVDFGNGDRQRLSEFPHSINWGVPYKFPYFFIKLKEEDKLEHIKKVFWNDFKEFCKKKEREKSMGFAGEGISLKKTHGFRDVIHGDIVFQDKFWKIIETQEFQRLLRIKQLALTSLVFPTVNHTRYEHSIGAYHIMCQVVDHFKVLDLKIDSDDSDIAILATLLHDIGHGPFSHAFERVMNTSHEEWTKRIILESPELNNAIKEGFGSDAPQRVVNCLNHKDSVRSTFPEKLNFSFIYSALVNGALDVDRLDYLLRDAYYTATKFGNIDIPKIISAIKLTSINGVYCLCFDKAYLPYLEQMIFARKEMYNNVYYDSRKVLLETLVEKIIQRAYIIRDKLNESDRKLLENFKECVRMNVSEYLLLDDYTMYECFKRWHKEVKDPILSMLTGSVLNKNFYEQALDVSAGSNERADLLKEIESFLGLGPNWDMSPNHTAPEESFAIFRTDKSITIYPDTAIGNDIGKTIIVSNQNGEIEDFAKITHFDSAEISWHYLFWSEKVLREAIKGKYTEKKADEMVEQMKKLLESYKPRNHIEIERKYLCSDKVLELTESLLTNELNAKDDNSFILSEPFNEKEQSDTYFDTKDHMLLNKGCTLRIRRLENNNYVCTVKLPIESINFGGNSPTARQEYESAASSNSDDPTELLKAQKTFIIKRLSSKGVITEEVVNSLEPILNVKNNRKKGTIEKANSDFKCEVCLDRVIYSSRDGVKKNSDYQIEIELKSDYLTHVILNQFTLKLEELLRKETDNFKSTETSKLERGLMQLVNSKT